MHREVSFQRARRRSKSKRSYIDRVKRRSELYLGSNLRQGSLITVITQGANKLIFKLDGIMQETRARAVALLHNFASAMGARFCPITYEMTVSVPQ